MEITLASLFSEISRKEIYSWQRRDTIAEIFHNGAHCCLFEVGRSDCEDQEEGKACSVRSRMVFFVRP